MYYYYYIQLMETALAMAGKIASFSRPAGAICSLLTAICSMQSSMISPVIILSKRRTQLRLYRVFQWFSYSFICTITWFTSELYWNLPVLVFIYSFALILLFLAVVMAKETVNASYELNLEEGLRFERRIFQALFATEDQKEGMAAFIEKRSPQWKHK